MNLPDGLRRWGRRGRRFLRPFGGVSKYLRYSCSRTAVEIGATPDAEQTLDRLVKETCRECGLDARTYETTKEG